MKGKNGNVRLLNRSAITAYKAGRKFKAETEGLVKKSPVRLPIPRDGHWYVVVDTVSLGGKVQSSVEVEPPPLKPLRSASRSPLSTIRQTRPTARPAYTDSEAVQPQWDVFISHAAEDKDAVAAPLHAHLKTLGVNAWLDSLELKIGDSLRRKIDHGLANSRFGVVIISRRYLTKGWTQYELDGLITRSVAGEQSLLPIWHEISKAEVLAASASLADKVALSTAQFTVEEIAQQIAEVVLPDSGDPRLEG